MLIAFGIVGGLFLLVALFFLVIHPLVCMVECALSKHFSGGKKLLWIAVSFFTGVFGSAIYTLFVTKSARLRKTSKIAFGTGALSFALAAGISFMSPEIKAFITPGEGSNVFADLEGFNEGDFENSMAELDEAMKALEKMAQDFESNGESIDGSALAEALDEKTEGRASAAIESAMDSWNANTDATEGFDPAKSEQEVFVSAGSDAESAQSILESTEELSRSGTFGAGQSAIEERIENVGEVAEDNGVVNNVFQLFDNLTGNSQSKENSRSKSQAPTKKQSSPKSSPPSVQKSPSASERSPSSSGRPVDTRQQPPSADAIGTRVETKRAPVRNRYLEQTTQPIYIVPADNSVRNRYLER